MNQRGRFLIVIALLIGSLALAHNQVAWASKSSDQGLLVENNELQPAFADHDNDYNHGSVKPPPKEIVITKSGTYSVGGFCTITITLTSPDVKAFVRVERLVPLRFPNSFQRIRQGCHVAYYKSGKRINELTPELGSSTICFAATPKKEMKLHFYNIYTHKPSWSALATTVNDGIACAAGNRSGTYVSTYKKR